MNAGFKMERAREAGLERRESRSWRKQRKAEGERRKENEERGINDVVRVLGLAMDMILYDGVPL